MVHMITQEKAEIISAMEHHLRNSLLHSEANKLWEHTYIKHQIDKRNKNGIFSVSDHIRAMVYSMLSSGRKWDCVVAGADPATGYIKSVDKIFLNYEPQQLLTCTPKQLRDSLKEIHCASQSTLRQMNALISVNIPKLLKLKQDYGTIDSYYENFIRKDETLVTLVKTLSNPKSNNKLAQMDIALVCEYLRNVGYDIPKPDRHICRILGSEVLNLSDKPTPPPAEVFEIIAKLAKKLNKSVAEVDYILWSYCANGYGEICTKNNPKCDKCTAKKYCKKGEK